MSTTTRSAFNFFLIFIVTFYSTEKVTGELFQIPTELAMRFFNVSLNSVYENCVLPDRCFAARNRDVVDQIETMTGEVLINNLVDMARRNPNITPNEWDTYIREKCLTDSSLITLSTTSVNAVGACSSDPQSTKNREAITNILRLYLPTYCASVNRISKQRIELGL